MNKNFCTLPWTGMDIGPQGDIKPCCKYQTAIARDLKSYTTSAHLADLKQQFLRGERPAGCKSCWDDEDSGLTSKRQIDHRYSFNDQQPGLDSLKLLALCFGNTCNLACVICNSGSSSRWATDERKMNPAVLQRPIYSHNQYYKDPEFMTQLINMCDDLVHLDIPGGEPFFASHDVHKTFLTSLKNPDQIKIHYTTNGTIFPDAEFWDIWSKFRHIDIQLSIDGTGQRYEYLRYPADWNTVSSNIRKFQQQSNIQLSVSHTVSWINVFYLDEFLQWCEQQGLPEPYVGPVAHPEFLSVKCLPADLKQLVRQHLGSSQREVVHNMLNYMDQDDHSNLFARGQSWVTELDRIRGQAFTKVFPEIGQIF